MLQCLKNPESRVDHEIGHKLHKLDTNHPFVLAGDVFEKLTDFNFVNLMYPITILQYLNKIIEVDHKIRGCIIFGQIDLGIRFCNFGPDWEQIARFSLLGQGIRRSPALAKNSH